MNRIFSISNLKFLEIPDENSQLSYGCDQQWYNTERQQMCGCGPSVACGIIWYLSHCLGLSQSDLTTPKDKCLVLMEEVWRFMTPSTEGIPSTKMFYESVLTYAESKGLNLEYRFCNIPIDESIRPEFTIIERFIKKGLKQNAPVAFLNLCNGKEENLERWHWVTIVSLFHEGLGERAFINILDSGLIKRIDLSLWYETTTRGGGFVYFTPVHNKSQTAPPFTIDR